MHITQTLAAAAPLLLLLLLAGANATPLLQQHTVRAAADWTTELYDYIVVGAGPAGIIVADRLSETGKKTLLLEQGGASYGITGGTERPGWLNGTALSRVDVPGLYNTIFSTGSPTLLCNARTTAYTGCSIGGTSSINAGLFIQPPASDWDTFHPQGWHAADVAPAIARLYTREASAPASSAWGGVQSAYTAAREWLVTGAGYAEVNLNDTPDRKRGVFGRTLFNYVGGQRGGPVVTYLQRALERPNFSLRSGVAVVRAVRTGAVVTGVLASVDGGAEDVTIGLTATGRVIFSGGAVFSPSLLMHSGIGPVDVLETMSQAGALDPALPPSQWIVNADVGAGLFDNPNTFIVLNSPAVQSYEYSYEAPVAADADLYLERGRTGPYAFAGQESAFWTYIDHADGSAPTGMQGTLDNSGAFDFNNGSTITLNVYGTSGLLSTGRVVVEQIGNGTKFIPGADDNLYYSDAAGRDADDIAQFIVDIFAALGKSNSGLEPLNIPRNATKEQIKTYITTKSNYAVGAVNHFSSSCRIGKCVDNTTRVIGMENLHVIDASILAPLTVNPQFGVMVAAERGAELIKGLIPKSSTGSRVGHGRV